MSTALNKVLIVGSAPDAVKTAHWDTSCFSHTVVINNAWKACPSWSCLIYPEDFPIDRHPSAKDMNGKRMVTAEEFVPDQNEFGGFVYAGGTMSFTAGYWSLGALKPDVIAYIGCDMVYETKPGQATHLDGAARPTPCAAMSPCKALKPNLCAFRLWPIKTAVPWSTCRNLKTPGFAFHAWLLRRLKS